MDDLYERLDNALLEYADEEAACVLGVSELDGFFHALACAPQVIMPSEWMPAIWGGEEFVPVWANPEQAGQFMADAMEHYNSVMQMLRNDECAPLFLEGNYEGEATTIVDEWCEGFYLGMYLWDDFEDDIPEDMLEPILFFTVDLDAPSGSPDKRDSATIEEIEALQQRIPQAVFELRALFGIGAEIETPPKPGNKKPSKR